MSQVPQPPTKEQKEERIKEYFTRVAPDYGHLTGQATRDIISSILNIYGADLPLSIDSSSVILDNAAGPGTATKAVITWAKSQGISDMPSITLTDFVPAMIDAANTIKSQNPDWKSVTPKVMDSQALLFESDSFTHIFCNFSIFTFTSPQDVLHEMYRTLRPNGTAVVTCWKRFAIDEIGRTAQKIVKGDDYADLMKMRGPEFAQEGYLEGLVVEAGWEKKSVKTVEESVTVKGKDLEGLVEFMSGDYAGVAASIEWSDEEKRRWPEAVKIAVEREVKEHDGIKMTGWAVLATK